MNLIINCDCGYVVRGASEDEMVDNAVRHAKDVHGMVLTREQALSLAVPADALRAAVTTVVDDPYLVEQQQVIDTLNDIMAAAAEKDFERLAAHHLDSPKFTKFDDFEPLDRQDAAVARRSEEEGLGGVENFAYHLKNLKVDVFGPVAIATFIFHYEFDAKGDHVGLRARTTMVFVSTGSTWKIAHEHLSPFVENM
jgi:ketosteroid isomerase-like protein/predicted small metal-binding protein